MIDFSGSTDIRPTLKQLKLAAKDRGMTVRKRDGEYRVAFNEKYNEAAAYYTNDALDAMQTMKDMSDRRKL